MWRPFTPDKDRRLRLGPVLIVILCWEIAAQFALINPSFYPPPSVILQTASELLQTGEFLHHFRMSVQRVLLSVLLGGSAGIGLGLVMGWSSPVRALFDPYISLLYPVPKIVLLPIMFSFFGTTELARVLTMSIAVFLIVAMQTIGAVRDIDDVYIEVAVDNGASRRDVFREVVLPATLPNIFTGLSLGFGLGFILIIVIEFIAADAGLGYIIWQSWQLFTIPRMYVALLSINVLGIVCIYGIERLGERLAPWQQS